MDDLDGDNLITRLSHMLETQSVALTDEGNSSTHDLLNRLAGQIDDFDFDEFDAETMYTEDMEEEELKGKYRVELPARPTPYEVWKSKQDDFEPRKHSRAMNEEEWDALVKRLHGTKRSKENTIKMQQNRELAEELRELKFQPTLNEKSMQIAKNTGKKSLIQRISVETEEKQRFLKAEREKRAQEEVSELRETPEMEGMKQSERILRASGGGGAPRRTIEDVLQYGEEAKLRRLQRKQILDEMEARELTFKPQLSHASKRMQRKAMREGRRLGTSTRRSVVRGGTGTKHDPGHEEEVFKPKISQLAASMRSSPSRHSSKRVHERLYKQGKQRLVAKQMEQQHLVEKYTKDIYVARTGITVAAKKKTETLNETKKKEEYNDTPKLHVFEYSPDFDFILEKLSTHEYDD